MIDGGQTRWGIAGYGDVVCRRVAPAIAATDRSLLSGIWGRRADRARATAQLFGAHGTDDLVELCGKVDAIYVATPVSQHLAIASVAYRAGCHVLIEKPVSAGLGDVSAFGDRTVPARQQIGVAYYRRLMPQIAWLRQHIASGSFGAPRRASVSFSSPFSPAPDDPKAWRLKQACAGGGVLADAGSHRLDLLAFLFGEPWGLEAHVSDLTEGNCERSADVRLDWGTDFQAHLDVRWDSRSHDRLELVFERAHLTLESLDGGCIRMRASDAEDSALDFSVPSNPHRALIEDFERAIRTSTAPVCNLEDGLLVDRMLIAAYRSSVVNAPVSLRAETLGLPAGHSSPGACI